MVKGKESLIASDVWVLRLDADGEIHLYDLGPAVDPWAEITDLSERVAWARGQWGIPEDWQASEGREEHGWDVAIMSGPVHPSLLAQATVESWDGYVPPEPAP